MHIKTLFDWLEMGKLLLSFFMTIIILERGDPTAQKSDHAWVAINPQLQNKKEASMANARVKIHFQVHLHFLIKI